MLKFSNPFLTPNSNHSFFKGLATLLLQVQTKGEKNNLKFKPEFDPFVNSLLTPLFETQVIASLEMNVGIQPRVFANQYAF